MVSVQTGVAIATLVTIQGCIASPVASSSPAEIPAPVVEFPDTAAAKRYVRTVFYATDRKYAGQMPSNELPLPNFTAERGSGLLSFGAIRVSVPDRGVVAPRVLFPHLFEGERARFVARGGQRYPSFETLVASMSELASEHHDSSTLIFIHGYNNTFGDAILRTAQIAEDIRFPGAAIAYSWPAGGGAVDYLTDRQNAEWTIPHLRSFLDSLALRRPGPISVIAHSTGAWAIARAVEGAQHLNHAFEHTVLVAADIDASVFREQFAGPFRRASVSNSIYGSANDVALALAARLVGGKQRLGETKPFAVTVDGFDTIDMSNAKIDVLGHATAFMNERLLNDLYYLIVLNQPAAKRYYLDAAIVNGRTVWVVRQAK